MDEAPLQLVLAAVAPERALAGRLSHRHDFVTVEVHTAAEVFESLGRLAYSVVILDAELPDMPGLDVCRLLRADPRVPKTVPILILTTGKPSPEQRVKALQAGSWDFLSIKAAEDLALHVQTYLQAKRNMDEALAESLVDPVTGLHTIAGLARRARELGALLAREPRGALACIVFAHEGRFGARETAALIGRLARVSDVVGVLRPGEYAVLAPATDGEGVVKLATRLEAALRRQGPAGDATISAGYDAVASVRYSPVEPMTLLSHAASALRTGKQDRNLPWLRSYVATGGEHTPALEGTVQEEARL